MDKRKLLGDLLRERRSRISPDNLGLERTPVQGRRAQGITQAEIDQLLYHSKGTYHRLENGRMPNPSIDLLAGVARLLRLTEVEWAALCRYAADRHPPFPIRPNSGREVPADWADLIASVPYPAWVHDQSWNVLTYNDAWAAVHPGGKPPANHMRWILLEEEAQRVLIGWKEYWAPPVLTELRMAVEGTTRDETLLQIEREVRADPVIGPIHAALPHAYTSTNGDHRPLHHHQLGDVWVTLLASEITESPGARAMFLRVHKHPPRDQRPMLRAQPHTAATAKIEQPDIN
ncbi:helix-turn-helix domain-containing protein [Streptomyces sp. UNOC14_S4]|uniref:helix-turn-helix domain-containing protein n=1 Tax=Streptomyces sp. UNOC14_S4 TaxID=2872340 RepID=UPI001E562FAF|nr:helix-turn-helix domain-containing protein [Streptomyces sp. UNOC14_S4]MCC3766459.1 helix-turn-helix transcriptional regulator [Streptomyces sp. UNOC14_S4]